MLTIHQPIQLQSTKQSLCLNEAFGEKIRTGYLLMNLQINPQKLLFLLGLADEEVQSMHTMGSTLVDARSSVSQQINVDVINNVVNRIMLSQSQKFTYQDNVYVNTVLEKMGINNVALFMSEMRKLQEKNNVLTQISKINTQNLHQVHQVMQTVNELSARIEGASNFSQEQKKQGLPNVFQNEVYQRLRRGGVHNYVSRWNSAEANFLRIINKNKALVAEQTQITAGLHFDSANEKNNVWVNTVLMHRKNVFEENTPKQEQSRQATPYVLHNEIYQRLRTGDVYSNVREWNHDETNFGHIISQNEMIVAEQTRIAAGLQFGNASEESEKSKEWINTVLMHRKNIFEEKSSELPKGHSSVQKHETNITAASLFTLVDNVMHTKMAHTSAGDDYWMQMPAAIAVAGENTMQRYEHSNYAPAPAQVHNVEELTQESTIAEVVEEYTQRNRAIYEYVEKMRNEGEKEKQFATPAKPNKAQIMKDALNQIEGKPLEFLQQAQEQEEMKLLHPEVPAEIKQLLAGADERTREVYEAILQYNFNPQAALASGVLKPASAEMLNAQASLMQEKQAEIIYRETEKTVHENIASHEKHLNEDRQMNKAARKIFAAEGKPILRPIEIIHRDTQRQTGDDTGENKSKASMPKTEIIDSQTVSREVFEKTQITQTNHQFAANATEDITEIINKTLTRELDAISSKVFNKMEKRLLNERVRRGW